LIEYEYNKHIDISSKDEKMTSGERRIAYSLPLSSANSFIIFLSLDLQAAYLLWGISRLKQ
jgi:hypothetical protein